MNELFQRGAVFEVMKSWDVLVHTGDKVLVSRGPDDPNKDYGECYFPGPALNAYPARPTHGTVPLYNGGDYDYLVEEGYLRFVEQVPEDKLKEKAAELREDQEKRQDAWYELVGRLGIVMGRYNLRTLEGRKGLDDAIMKVLLECGPQTASEFANYWFDRDWQHIEPRFDKAIKRLLVAGRILPLEEGTSYFTDKYYRKIVPVEGVS